MHETLAKAPYYKRGKRENTGGYYFKVVEASKLERTSDGSTKDVSCFIRMDEVFPITGFESTVYGKTLFFV